MKFIDNLRAVDTGQRRIVEDNLISIKYTSDPLDISFYPVSYAKEYSIVVKLGTSQWIDEDIIIASKGEVVRQAVEEMKHAIVEELYGELRRDLRQLHMDLRNTLNHRDHPCLEKLNQIMEKITL